MRKDRGHFFTQASIVSASLLLLINNLGLDRKCLPWMECEAPKAAPEILLANPHGLTPNGSVSSSVVTTACAKLPGPQLPFQNGPCNGNWRDTIEIPNTNLNLVYNSVRCTNGWTLSIDWKLRSQSANVKVLISPEGREQIFNKVAGQERWTFQYPHFDPSVLTTASGGRYVLNGTDGKVFTFTAKAGEPSMYELTAFEDAKDSLTFDRSSTSQTRIVDRYNRTITVDRNTAGRVTAITGIRNERTTTEYDALGNLSTLRFPTGEQIKMAYNQAIFVFLSTGEPAPPEAAQNCILTAIQRPHEGVVTMRSYADGVVQSVKGHGETRFSYTPTWTGVSRSGLNEIYRYSGGNLTSFTSQNLTTRYVWDSEKRLVEMNEPYGRNSYRAYSNGRLATERGPDNILRTYSYDGSGNLASIQDGTSLTRYEVQQVGFQKLFSKITHPSGQVDRMVYDTKGRLKQKFVNNVKVEDNTYNTAGLLTRSETQTGVKTFNWDGYGNPLSETNEFGETTNFGYEWTGAPQQVTSPEGFVTDYLEKNGWGIPERKYTYSQRNGYQLVSDIKEGNCLNLAVCGGIKNSLVRDRVREVEQVSIPIRTGHGRNSLVLTETRRTSAHRGGSTTFVVGAPGGGGVGGGGAMSMSAAVAMPPGGNSGGGYGYGPPGGGCECGGSCGSSAEGSGDGSTMSSMTMGGGGSSSSSSGPGGSSSSTSRCSPKDPPVFPPGESIVWCTVEICNSLAPGEDSSNLNEYGCRNNGDWSVCDIDGNCKSQWNDNGCACLPAQACLDIAEDSGYQDRGSWNSLPATCVDGGCSCEELIGPCS